MFYQNLLAIAVLFVNSACQNSPAIQQATEIIHDTVYIEVKDTSHETIGSDDDLNTKLEQIDSVAEKKTIEEEPNLSPVNIENQEEPINKHFYSGTKKVSVITETDEDRQKKTQLFNRKQELTYEFQDVRSSYSIRTELTFRSDGSVERAITHTNPDASMYWYETTITFTEDNEPFEKTSVTYPMEQLEMPVIMRWNKEKREWFVPE